MSLKRLVAAAGFATFLLINASSVDAGFIYGVNSNHKSYAPLIEGHFFQWRINFARTMLHMSSSIP